MQRIVLLGASNLSLGFESVVSLCQLQLEKKPRHIYFAMGHGRSYGNWSRLFSRKLPGILQCGLWDALNELKEVEENLRTVALLTDIGNDLLYGATPRELSTWVRRCVEQLQEQHTKIVLALPPIRSIESISAWRFVFFRTLFFPKATKNLSQLLNEVTELNSLLEDLAKTHSLILKEPHNDWYGFDPIHIRRRLRTTAWHNLLNPLLPDSRQSDSKTIPMTISSRLKKTIRPEYATYRQHFGKADREVRVTQPCYEYENLKISVF